MKSSELFVKCLENEGVECIFGVPGEENEDMMMSLLDSSIKFIPTRHEQGAAFMAAIHGRLTGKAGVCLSTLGPGAMNLTTGLAEAKLGNNPVVAITGQGGLGRDGREKFQVVNVKEVFEPLCKWNATIKNPADVPEMVRKAFRLAQEERPGPCHLELPEDVAEMETEGEPLAIEEIKKKAADSASIDKAVSLIKNSKNPLIIAGNGVLRQNASQELKELSEKAGIMVLETQMGKGSMDNRHPNSLFSIGINGFDFHQCAIQKADLIIALGYNVVELEPAIWNTKKDKKIIHFDAVSNDRNEHYVPVLEVLGDLKDSLFRIMQKIGNNEKKSIDYFQNVKKEIIKNHSKYETGYEFPMKPQRIFSDLRKALGEKDIVIADVGMNKIWAARQYKTYAPNTCLIDNALCSMGISVPGAIAAKLVFPDRKVVSINGDGGFMMNSQEVETAIRLGQDIVIVIFNNSKYGMIEWKQLKNKGKSHGNDFSNPDFVKYAESFGAKGYRIKKAEEFLPMLKQALGNNTVSIIDVPIDDSENMSLVRELKQNICP